MQTGIKICLGFGKESGTIPLMKSENFSTSPGRLYSNIIRIHPFLKKKSTSNTLSVSIGVHLRPFARMELCLGTSSHQWSIDWDSLPNG